MADTITPLHADARPALLFHCQHSLGIGHLTRSFALAAALAPRFRVVFLNGGKLPPGVPVPAGIELVDLPPLGMDDGHTVVSRDGADLGAAQAGRRALIEDAVRRHRPAVVLVELFPFGRKKFTGELLGLIRAARRRPGGPALVACSLRDILVDARRDQQRHDDRARWLADRYFDIVLVHSDPAFARLEDSFRPRRPLAVPVRYTGYVVPARERAADAPRGAHLLVSAGGSMVGEPLLAAVLRARPLMRAPVPMRLVAGPFLPEPAWQALRQAAAADPAVELVRHVPDMVAEMRAARASVSQCGYNTALDLVVSGVPALVVPYGRPDENEQSGRAAKLAALGALQALPEPALADPARVAAALDALLAFRPRAAALDLDGARRSAEHLAQRLAEHLAQRLAEHRDGRQAARAAPVPQRDAA